jgi:hypothetical protein
VMDVTAGDSFLGRDQKCSYKHVTNSEYLYCFETYKNGKDY